MVVASVVEDVSQALVGLRQVVFVGLVFGESDSALDRCCGAIVISPGEVGIADGPNRYGRPVAAPGLFGAFKGFPAEGETLLQVVFTVVDLCHEEVGFREQSVHSIPAGGFRVTLGDLLACEIKVSSFKQEISQREQRPAEFPDGAISPGPVAFSHGGRGFELPDTFFEKVDRIGALVSLLVDLSHGSIDSACVNAAVLVPQ